MPEGMTTEGVAAKQDDIDREHECSDSDSERNPAARITKPQRFPDIDRQNHDKDDGKVQEIAVNVLHDQRKGPFTEVRFARLAHRARGRIGPERFIVGPAIVITGEPESTGRPQNQKGWRK